MTAVLLCLISGQLIEAAAQQNTDLLRQRLFESYIHASVGENQQLPDNLASSELTILSRAHYERARVIEAIYLLTLYSGELLLTRMGDELDDSGAQSSIQRLRERQRAAKRSLDSSAQSDLRSGSLERFLVDWHNKGMTHQACEESTTGCRLISLLQSNDPRNYDQAIALLHGDLPDRRQNLLDSFVEASTLEKRGEMIVTWINQLHLHVLTDYILAAWLSEMAENDETDVYYFYAGHWDRFGDPVAGVQNLIDLYRAIGHSMAKHEHCSSENLPESVTGNMGTNNEMLVLSVAAMARCSSVQLLEENFSGMLNTVEANNRAQAQRLATALIAIGHYNTALNELSQQVSRNDVYQLSRATPHTMSTLAYLRFHAIGAENWREAREFVVRLGREFSAISSAALILQIATEPEIRQSINVHTD